MIPNLSRSRKNKDNVKFKAYAAEPLYLVYCRQKEGKEIETLPAPTFGSEGAEMDQAH